MIKKRFQIDDITNAERAFVFKLFLCNPFARSAGIFFQFCPLSLRYRDPATSPLNARQYMFENRAIKLINRQLSWLTGSLTSLRAFTRFYALLCQLSSLACLRAFTRFYALLSQLSSLAVYSVYSLLR